MMNKSKFQPALCSLQILSSVALLLTPGCDGELGGAAPVMTSHADASSWRAAESPCTVHFLGVQESPAEGSVEDTDEDYVEIIDDPPWAPDPDSEAPGDDPNDDIEGEGGYLQRYPDTSWAQGAALTVEQRIKQHWGDVTGPTKGFGQKTHFQPVIKVVCSDPSITKDDIKVRMVMHYEGDMTLGTKNKAYLWGSHALAKAHTGVIGGFRRHNENEGTRLVAWSQNYLRIHNKKPFDAEAFGKKLINLAKIASDLGIAISKVVPGAEVTLGGEAVAGAGVGASGDDSDYYNFNEDKEASSDEATLPVAVTNRWGFPDDQGQIEPNQPFTIEFHTETMMQTQVKGAAESYTKLGSQFLLGVVVEFPGACDKDFAGLMVAGVTRPTPLASYNGAKGFSAMAERAQGFLNSINLPSEIAQDGDAAVGKVRSGKVPFTDFSGSMVVTGFGNSYQFGN